MYLGIAQFKYYLSVKSFADGEIILVYSDVLQICIKRKLKKKKSLCVVNARL